MKEDIRVLWAKSYRNPAVVPARKKDKCSLCCQGNRPLFAFTDNEGEDDEQLCLSCLEAAVELLKQA